MSEEQEPNVSNVRELVPSNLASIPTMLRYWAAELESGREPMPRAAYLILVDDGNTPPSVCKFGQEISRLEEAGALFFAASQPLQLELEPEGG